MSPICPKYRLPEGRQVQKKLGPAWTERGRSPAGYFTKRLAEDWLRSVLDEARRGTLPGMVRTGATFADAAAEYLRYVEQDRGRKPSTLRGYRSAIEAHLLPVFGSMPVEDVTTSEIERWIAGFRGSVRTRNKLLIQLHGILGRARKAYGLTALRRRYKAALELAALRPLRFHDLRHIFGTRMIAKADIRRVQEWMGHADIQTTMRYLHYAPREEDAELVAEAFRVSTPVSGGPEDLLSVRDVSGRLGWARATFQPSTDARPHSPRAM